MPAAQWYTQRWRRNFQARKRNVFVECITSLDTLPFRNKRTRSPAPSSGCALTSLNPHDLDVFEFASKTPVQSISVFDTNEGANFHDAWSLFLRKVKFINDTKIFKWMVVPVGFVLIGLFSFVQRNDWHIYLENRRLYQLRSYGHHGWSWE